MSSTAYPTDFFISHCAADSKYAHWLADWLHSQHYSTCIQARDFSPGENFIQEMADSIGRSWKVLALYSSNYFDSRWCNEEWTAALYDHKLVGLMIRACELPALLRPHDYIDLVGQEQQGAANNLLAALERLRRASSELPVPRSSYPVGPVSAPHSRTPELRHIPLPRNHFFTGRAPQLQALQARLTAPSERRPQALCGLDGIGKTQTAIEYCYRHGAEHTGIWWLRAGDLAELTSDYLELGSKLGVVRQADLMRAVDDVRAALSARDGLLLVFDNATLDVSLAAFLPQNPSRQVIITTSSHTFPDAEATLLPSLSHAEASELVLSSSSRRSRNGNESPDAEQRAAGQIADLLGGLPLALAQAAAYIVRREKTLADYALLLSDNGVDALAVPDEYRKEIGTTWKLALDALDDDAGAGELLQLLCCLAPEAVDLRELAEASAVLEAQGPIAFLNSELTRDNAKAALLDSSLISAQGEEVTVHPVLQQVVRRRLRKAGAYELWLGLALEVVRARFPEYPERFETWQRCSRWLAHARVTTELARASSERNFQSLTARLSNLRALYLKSALADLERADALYRDAVALGERALDPAAPELAVYYNNLAELLRASARFEEAEQFYEKAIAIDEQHEAEDGIALARDLNNLGLLNRQRGQFDAAEQLVQRALELIERSASPDDRLRATYLNNLGRIAHEQGRLEQAQSLIASAIEIERRILKPQDPGLAVTLNNLGRVLDDRGLWTEATSLFSEALEICKASLPGQHPIAERVLRNLERVMSKVGPAERTSL